MYRPPLVYVTTVRFPDDLADLMRAAAERDGTTFSAWLRDAAMLRLAHGMTSREIAEIRERLDRIELTLAAHGITPPPA